MNNITVLPKAPDEFLHQGNAGRFERFLVRHFVEPASMDSADEILPANVNARRWERKHIRIEAVYPIHISVLSNGAVVNQTMGKTLNLGESGILVETNISILSNHAVFITLALEDHILELEGRVVHRSKRGKFFRTGIIFANPTPRAQGLLKRFINKSRDLEKRDRKRSMSRIYIRELAGVASNRLLNMTS